MTYKTQYLDSGKKSLECQSNVLHNDGLVYHQVWLNSNAETVTGVYVLKIFTSENVHGNILHRIPHTDLKYSSMNVAYTRTP